MYYFLYNGSLSLSTQTSFVVVVWELELDLLLEELPELYVLLIFVDAEVFVPIDAPVLPEVEVEPEL